MRFLEPVKDDLGVVIVNGVPMASSRAVARNFKKRHDHVLRDIESILTELNNMTHERKINPPNFGEIAGEPNLLKIEEIDLEAWRRKVVLRHYTDRRGRKQPEYFMDRDFFMLLVMGYTGPKAMRIKMRYIERFNLMEQYIFSRDKARKEFRALTDAIKASRQDAQFYHYKNEADLINRIVLGMSAKEYRLAHGIPQSVPLRDCLTPEQVRAIEILQGYDTGLVYQGLSYQERKQALQELYNRIRVLGLPGAGNVQALPGN